MNGMREPTGQYSIKTPHDIADAADARRIERDHLNELIARAEAEHGPITAEEIQALRDQLHQARREQGVAAGSHSRPGPR